MRSPTLTPANAIREPEQSPGGQVSRISLGLANCLQYLLVGLLLEWLLFGGTSVDGRLRAGGVAVVLLGMALGQAWFVVFAIQLSLFFREPSDGLLNLGTNIYAYVVLALVLIFYAFSARSSVPAVSHWFARQLQKALASQQDTALTNDSTVSSPRRSAYLVITEVFVLTAVIVASTLLLNFLPITPDGSRRWLQRSLADGGMLWPGPTIFVVLLLVWIVVRELAWRQVSYPQARLWLRSEFVNYHFRDLLMIVRRLRRSSTSRKP